MCPWHIPFLVHCRRLLLTQCGSRLMWLALIHNELWHKWLASPWAFRTSFKLKFVGVFIKAKRCTATRLHTPGPCKETFTHMTPYRTPRPLQQPFHIMHCPLSDTLDLELSLSIISNRRTSIFTEEVSTNITLHL